MCVNRKWNNGPLYVTVMSAGSGVVNVAIGKSEILASPVFFNLLTPNVNYSGRTAPLTSKVAFYIFIQQI